MPKRTSRLPPPPPPPIITIDDDDDDEKPKEDGELSDDDSREAKPIPYRIKSKKKEENIPDTPAEGSDIEVIGDNLYDIDDNGCDDDGLDITMNIDDDEVFKKMQKAAGINNDDIDISINITQTPKATRGQGTCFNCDGPHTLAECTTPHDRRRINRNRQSFGSTRRERITEHIESKFTPGQLSDEAKKALNLYDEEYPQWIMRMRDMGPFQGYPPGYLKRFKPSDKRLSFFCDDPHLTNETVKAEVEFDPEKIVYYDGFNLIDKRSEAERYCNQNVRKELQWKKWNKHSYPIEFEKFLKTSIIEDKAAESRKRQHGFDNNEQYSSKRDKEKERKREKRAAARKVEKENKKWQNYKLDLAKEKLVEDFKNTDISKEPEKILMNDETFGIFAPKKQRKKIDRERLRSAGSLEAEANWVKTMEEEAWAAKEAKAKREELAKQQKAEKKSPPKEWKEKRAEKFAKKKAEREERDKRRLKIEKHMIEVGTQTEKVRILPWISDDEEGVNEATKIKQSDSKPSKEHGVNILSKLFPHMAIEAKVFKEESHDNHVAASNNVHSSLTAKSPFQAVEKKLQDKGDVQETLHQQVKSSAGTEIEISDGIPQLLNEILDELEGPKELCPSPDKSVGSAKSTEEIKPDDDVEVVDIVTVKQYREKLHALNDNFQNALKSFQPSYNKKPVEKKLEYRRDASKIPKTLKDDILPPRKQFVHPQSGPSKPNEKPSTINPPVSKQELKKFQRQNFAKDTSQSSAKDTVISKPSAKDTVVSQPSAKDTVISQLSVKDTVFSQPSVKDTVVSQPSVKEIKKQRPGLPTNPSLPVKQQKGKQYLSDPNLSTPKRSKHSSTKSKEKLTVNPPKQESKNFQEKRSSQQSSAKNPTTVPSQQNKKSEKKKGQRNDPPPDMECAYGAPLTFSEANVLSRMPINDTKPKVSAPRKQREKERGRYKNDPQIPPSSKKNEKKGRYDSDANAAAASSSSHSNQGRPNSHTVFSDLPDTPASPELPPVVSRALTEDQATPKGFLVPVVDARKMPDKDNFAAGITPFQYDNLAKRTNRMDIMEELLKSIKKD